MEELEVNLVSSTGQEYRCETTVLNSLFKSSVQEEILQMLPLTIEVIEKDGCILGAQDQTASSK